MDRYPSEWVYMSYIHLHYFVRVTLPLFVIVHMIFGPNKIEEVKSWVCLHEMIVLF